MGMVYRRGNTFWLKFYRDGVPIRQSANTTKETEARKLLKRLEGEVERGVPLSPKVGRVTVAEAP